MLILTILWINLFSSIVLGQVPMTPNITSVSASPCNSSLTITWAPNYYAMGIKHRISLTNGSGEILQAIAKAVFRYNVYRTPQLTDSSQYNVTITPCPTECIGEYASTKPAVTGGLPEAVKHVTMKRYSFMSNKGCRVDWAYPEVTPRDFVTGFKVTQNDEIAELPAGESRHEFPTNVINVSYSYIIIVGGPNIRSFFKVQAITCAGLGPESEAVGSCVSDKREPDYVTKPVIENGIQENGTAVITVDRPNQSNGPISCLFVMVIKEGNKTATPINALEELQKANETGGDYSHQHIAKLLAVPRFQDQSISILLGDNSRSSCNVYSISSTEPPSGNATINMVFYGFNRKLQPDQNYSVYLVTTTPSHGKILIKASNIERIEERITYGSDPSAGIAWVLLGSCLIFLLIASLIVCVIWQRRRSQDSTE